MHANIFVLCTSVDKEGENNNNSNNDNNKG